MSMDDPEHARIQHGQQLLFPQSARELSEAIGLNWWAACKLHEEGWLSFDPKSATALDQQQEHELRFIGSLVAAGCDHLMLCTLLEGLARPYCYAVGAIYYDWPERRWRLLPEPPPDPEEAFEDWLAAIEEEGDASQLEELLSRVDGALRRIRSDGDEAGT